MNVNLTAKLSKAILKYIERKTNIIGIKDSRETMITTEVALQVVDNSNTLSFTVRKANRKSQNQNVIAPSATKL